MTPALARTVAVAESMSATAGRPAAGHQDALGVGDPVERVPGAQGTHPRALGHHGHQFRDGGRLPDACRAEPHVPGPVDRPAGPAGAGQQDGLRRMGPANAPMVFGPTLPYCLSPPKELPFGMLPNSHTHLPPTFAWVKYG